MDEAAARNDVFPLTNWTLVRRAGEESGAAKRMALGELLPRYLSAMRSHLIYRKRLDPLDAEDMLQAFIASKVLEADLISSADPERGKFRTFLLTSLDRFTFNQLRDRKAKKRGGMDKRVSLDDELQSAEPGHQPKDAFDIQWGREVLGESLRRMEAACAACGRPDLWGVFEARVVGPTLGETKAVDYDVLVKRFGYKSPSQASNALITANRTFQRILREVIGEYASDETEIESEIEDLRTILSGSGTNAD